MVRGAQGRGDEAMVITSVYNSGTSGPSKLKVRYRGPNDTDFAAEVTAKDSAGNDIEIDQNDFDLIYSQNMLGTWLLFARRNGDTNLSQYWSDDNGETWNRKAL